MGGCIRKPNDEYAGGIVREIRHGRDMVQRGEDVDCERADAEQARVVAGGVGEWDGVAGCEDSVADGGGGVSGRKRRRVDEQDDGRGDDDDDNDAVHDYDDDDGDGHKCALRIYGVYV